MSRRNLWGLGAACIATLVLGALGCSSSTAPAPPNTPIQLYMLQSGVSLDSVAVKLQIRNGSTPIQGAHLTIRYAPAPHTDTILLRSDANGLWLLALKRSDTVQQYAFRAYKDSLVSNYVLFP